MLVNEISFLGGKLNIRGLPLIPIKSTPRGG